MKKRHSPDRPICVTGKITFEFFNNEDEEFKMKSLHDLCKEARKLFNLSCLPVDERLVENPESGTIVLSVCAANLSQAKETLNKVLEYFDQKAPARILDESIEEIEIT